LAVSLGNKTNYAAHFEFRRVDILAPMDKRKGLIRAPWLCGEDTAPRNQYKLSPHGRATARFESLVFVKSAHDLSASVRNAPCDYFVRGRNCCATDGMRTMKDKMLTKSMVDDPAHLARSCRMRAEEMYTIASAMTHTEVRASLERQAKEWERMALHAEQRITTPKNSAPRSEI
jgi:hypothetical protein